MYPGESASGHAEQRLGLGSRYAARSGVDTGYGRGACENTAELG